MEYCCLSDGNCCKYVLRVELARTPDKAGSLALRRKQERLGRSFIDGCAVKASSARTIPVLIFSGVCLLPSPPTR